MKPVVDQSFWSDPDIESAKPGVKLAALWLITNSQTSPLGLCGASASRFMFETGLPAAALESLLEAMPRSATRFGSVIFLRNYIRHQFGSGEKLRRNNSFTTLNSLFENVKDEALRACILEEYPEFQQGPARASKPSEGLASPSAESDKSAQPSPKKRTRTRRPVDDQGPLFAAFWNAYPKKLAKGDAERAWQNHRCNEIAEKIMATLAKRKQSPDWRKDGGAFIPYPATWLNAKGWEDEPQLPLMSTSTAPKDEDPAGWREWLKEQAQPYKPFRFAMEFQQKAFENR